MSATTIAPSTDVAVSAKTVDSEGNEIPCECMLCDLPMDAVHEAVEWKLTFRFTGPPAQEFGEATMLLCDHCLRDWVDNSADFGGEPVSYHRI